MTMPHLMNCGHGDAGQHGWCLDCVKELHADGESLSDRLDAALRENERIGAALYQISGLTAVDGIDAVAIARKTLSDEPDDDHHAMMNGPRIAQSLSPEYINKILDSTGRGTNTDDRKP